MQESKSCALPAWLRVNIAVFPAVRHILYIIAYPFHSLSTLSYGAGRIGQSRTDNQGYSTAISLHAVKLCRLSYYPVLNSAIGLSPMGDKVGFGCASLPTVSIDQSLIVTCLFHISYF